jgi:hypothetical protein
MTTIFRVSGFDAQGPLDAVLLLGIWDAHDNFFNLTTLNMPEPSSAMLFGLAGAIWYATAHRRKRIVAPIHSSIGVERSLG